MSAKARADLILKLHKFVKKEFAIIAPPTNRTVIEHMLYGCCLENSTYEAADEAFAKLQQNFFDWNEVRVTTASELAELTKHLAFPKQAALSIKKTLHGIFECYYQFDLEFLRKENLSKAILQFEKFKGVSPFVVSYVAQHGLGGHSIPLDRSMMLLFYTLGIANEEEATSGHVPSLERTIPKAKGIEFASLVHQLAVAFAAAPFNLKIRDQLLKINKDAKDLFPKRGVKTKPAEVVAPVEVNVVVKKDDKKDVKTKIPEKIEVPKTTPGKKTKLPEVKKKPTKASATTKKSPPAKPAAPTKKKLPTKAGGKPITKSPSRPKPR